MLDDPKTDSQPPPLYLTVAVKAHSCGDTVRPIVVRIGACRIEPAERFAAVWRHYRREEPRTSYGFSSYDRLSSFDRVSSSAIISSGTGMFR